MRLSKATQPRFSGFLLFCLATLTLGSCSRDRSTSTNTPPPSPGSPIDFNAHDTPILVGGGAMTFYLGDKQGGNYLDWNPALGGTRSKTYCALVSSISPVVLEHSDNVKPLTLSTNASGWTLQLMTKANVVTMTANSNGSCGGAQGMAVQITTKDFSPDATYGTGFYPDELLPAGKHTRRFLDARRACQADRDGCERLTSVAVVNGASEACSNQNCMLYIGQPLSK